MPAVFAAPTAEEKKRWRRNRYHLVASSSRLTDVDDYLYRVLTKEKSGRSVKLSESDVQIREAKICLLRELIESRGEVTGTKFRAALTKLTSLAKLQGQWDARRNSTLDPTETKRLEGMWVALTKPIFRGCLGQNSSKEYTYTLGDMSFGMFLPNNLVCSIQGTFNPVHVLGPKDRSAVEFAPKSLQNELSNGDTLLRNYDVVTAFTIEPGGKSFEPACPNQTITRPIKGIMTTRGYVLPDPTNPNRLSVWFTGGKIEVNDDELDLDEWRRIFGNPKLTKRHIGSKVKVLAAKVLLGASPPENNGMEEDGTASYKLRRPIGGHGKAYVDVLYLDETLRIVESNMGAVYVFARVQNFDEE